MQESTLPSIWKKSLSTSRGGLGETLTFRLSFSPYLSAIQTQSTLPVIQRQCCPAHALQLSGVPYHLPAGTGALKVMLPNDSEDISLARLRPHLVQRTAPCPALTQCLSFITWLDSHNPLQREGSLFAFYIEMRILALCRSHRVCDATNGNVEMCA